MTAFEVPRTDLVAALAAKAASPGPPLLVTGRPGAGKSWLLRVLRAHLSAEGLLPIALDLFGATSSPDRFVLAALAALPAGPLAESLPAATRLRVLAESGRPREAEAVAALFELFSSLEGAGGRRIVLLLDEATEIRSLAYFRGLREVHESFLQALSKRRGGTVLFTSFPTLAHRLWPSMAATSVPPLSLDELAMASPSLGAAATDLQALHRLTGGTPRYVSLLWPRLLAGASAEDAWTSEMEAGGLLDEAGHRTFETLLLRSRGYGMSKSVLGAVAREEGLNLTALVRRLGRTPGATRDYLQWLVDVDALRREGKRYYFVDPVLRAWVRLHAQGALASTSAVRALAAELGRAKSVEAPSRELACPTPSPIDEPVPQDRGQPVRPSDPLMEID
jgi:hypothetical protein